MELQGDQCPMREKKTHIYVDSQEKSILLHSLVELAKTSIFLLIISKPKQANR